MPRLSDWFPYDMKTPRQRALRALDAKVKAAQSTATVPNVAKELNAFRRAQGPYTGLNKHYMGSLTSTTPREMLERLGAWGVPEVQRWYHRHPKKRNLRHARVGPLVTWREPYYKHIQGVRRDATYVNAMTTKAARARLKRANKKRASASPSASNANNTSSANSSANSNANNENFNPVEGLAPRFYTSKTKRDDRWLALYMKLHALRAPHTPLRAPRGALFRGVMLTNAQHAQLLSGKAWTDKGYMSFTRDADYAMSFGSRQTRWKGKNFVLFKLPLDRVARGTPWIWFVGEKERKMWIMADDEDAMAFGGWNVQGEPEESEVTLPPGTMRVLSTQHIPNRAFYKFETVVMPDTATLVDVDFVPDKEFAFKPRRKGAREENTNIAWNVFANQIKRGLTRRPVRSNTKPAKRGRST